MAGWFSDENPHESWKKLDDLGVYPHGFESYELVHGSSGNEARWQQNRNLAPPTSQQWPAVANWLVVPLQTMLKSNLWGLFFFLSHSCGCKSIRDITVIYRYTFTLFFLVCFRTLGLGLFKRFGRDNRDMKCWFAKRASDESKYNISAQAI